MTPEQCLRGRELLGWTRLDLADEVGCRSETIKNFEERKRAPPVAIVIWIRHAFKAAGVIGMDENDRAAGVRLRTPTA